MDYVVFTGGGTGGHILPGIAVAEVLNSTTDYKIVWIGSSKGVDRDIVLSSGLDFLGIPAGKLRRYFSFQNLVDVFKVLGGFIKSFFILLKLKPKFLFSKGGFVSVPPCAAAKILKIPIITHECDFSPGLATKLNSKFAKAILVSYQKTADFFPHPLRRKIIYTGNPVRLSFYNADAEKGRIFLEVKNNKPILLILGGSLGAKQINDLVSDSIDFLIENFIVVHQAGAKNMEQTEQIQERLKKIPSMVEDYKPYSFIKEEMPEVLSAASLVLSRAGANTLWEAAAAGKPMILIPLEKGSSRGDQIENADFFKKAGAAEVISGQDVNSDNLKILLEEFLINPKKWEEKAKAAKGLASNKPAEVIAEFLRNVAYRGF